MWAYARWRWGDSIWLLAVVNAFALYLFAPLPLALLLALLARHRLAWLSALLSAALFFGLFGADLTPPIHAARIPPEAPRLRVMTYNILFSVPSAHPIAATVRQAQPDVVGFQEMTARLERALSEEIAAEYPYRTGRRPGCTTDVAIWSRFPLQEEQVPPELVCRMQQALIEAPGRRVRVVNIHIWPYTRLDRTTLEQTFRYRRRQIEEVLAHVAGGTEPLILLGDLNSTPLHEVYRLVTAYPLIDSHREAGLGFGHTFPAHPLRNRSLIYPPRLVRIDYIFHSAALRAERVRVAKWDGQSDHLPVVADLRLTNLPSAEDHRQ